MQADFKLSKNPLILFTFLFLVSEVLTVSPKISNFLVSSLIKFKRWKCRNKIILIIKKMFEKY